MERRARSSARRAIALVAAFWPLLCTAHEVRPAYLELRETGPGEFRVLWKTPTHGDTLALEPEFSGDVTPTSPVWRRTVPGAAMLETSEGYSLTPLGDDVYEIAALGLQVQRIA